MDLTIALFSLLLPLFPQVDDLGGWPDDCYDHNDRPIECPECFDANGLPADCLEQGECLAEPDPEECGGYFVGVDLCCVDTGFVWGNTEWCWPALPTGNCAAGLLAADCSYCAVPLFPFPGWSPLLCNCDYY